MTRPIFATRKILMVGEDQRNTAIAALLHAPLGLEVLIREPVRVRGMDANALMWVGPLKDISEQAWLNNRQYGAEVWHEQFKREYLPEEDATDLHEMVKDPFTWRKWDYMPNGERVLVGSTTDLTKKGFSQYLTQIEADGAGLGVQFGVRRMAA